jgi:uncharacterized protein DUF3854
METIPKGEPKRIPQPPGDLSDEHRRMLEEESANLPDVIAERGVRTITRGRALPEGFSSRQRRRAPGILFTVHRPNGETDHCFRPNAVDPEKPGHKYEMRCKAYGAPGNVLDIHPSLRHLKEDVTIPAIFVEGIKKADATTSAARRAGVHLLVIAISGVWNFLSNGPIPDMFDVPVEGRRVTICFDSDMLRNSNVQDAAKRLAEHLIERGAEVWITYLPDKPDGSKMGADDFFADDGTFAKLRMLTRRYDPADLVRLRLSRDERLRAGLEDLGRTYRAMPAAKVGECSDRATMRDLIRRAKCSGKPSEAGDGIIVRASVRATAKKTRLSTRGQLNSLGRLEENGYLKRIEEPKRKTEESGTAYLLYADCIERTLGKQHEREPTTEDTTIEGAQGENPHRERELSIGVYLTCASESVPELRHPKVVHTWARREGRRVVVDSDYVYRLGKPGQEILMYLLDNDDEASEVELLERFGSQRTVMRNFRRRRLAPLQGFRYTKDKETGKERKLETGPPMVTSERGVVRILPEWRPALEEHRRQTDELADNKRQEQRYRDQSKAYRSRDRRPADEQPSPLRGKDAVARLVEERRREDKERWVEEQRTKVGQTAATFLADELGGATAVRFQDVRGRWAMRGGGVEELRKAVLYGPWRFVREGDGDLYIYREDDSLHRPAGPNERLWRERSAVRNKQREEPKMPPKVDGVYQHGPLCACAWCDEPVVPSYAKSGGTA